MKYHVGFDIEFRKNPYKGIYIALEGIDGSGKSTQAKILADYLKKNGKKVVFTKEPTQKPPVGDLIHNIIQGKVNLPLVSLQYLFSADREIHLKTVVEPALKEGKIIISDRCFWSSVAYGILDKMENSGKLNNEDLILVSQSILSMYHQFIVPDITFYIKVSEEIAIKRLSKMNKKKEYYETLEKLKNIKAGYDWLARKFSKEITVVDGEKSVEEVAQEIVRQMPF
ncbi:MAG: dTMP kinase [Candidatus Levybacteria bacterium RIFCSPLOWO2_02_FULL_37_10]|nr:MAG: dTMP kinase [Candidatus Levybacteria bacterium RIFCSPHIGHO2_01_FULL_37_33]OGH16094.1 MAG: dTMP kinase [Candidatus Levybacteria bacterium RIFCSPHIGHO2_02_FULL_37_11]OGH30180.1 MAG: dTMP kinase [Candidatus Levybacteria bacterium RIFCSPHIGHO2_12_FULL_37_12]OGH43175.1 MAG: dTMP kinase [Candidatus Levybacteria bacterium RIFCSPLOWO2_02_FULL_37_10]